MRAFAAALVLVFLAVATGEAQDGASALVEAERAYVDVDFETTRRAARDAVDAGGLDIRDLARAYELLAVSSAALVDDEAARDAYVRLLVLAPDARPSDILPPERRNAYHEARAIVALQHDPLSVEVRWDSSTHTVRVMVRDLLGLATQVRFERFVTGAPAVVSDVQLERGTATIPLPAADGDLLYAVSVLDSRGNHLLERGSDETPARLQLGAVRTPPTSPASEERHGMSRRTRRILWIGSAAVVVAAGALTAGLVYRARHNSPLVTDVVVTPLSAR